MARLYIQNDMARFSRKDITLVDMELYTGQKIENLEPHRLFPLSGLEKYITLLDERGMEQAIIRDIRSLPPADRKIIEDCLREYYLIPKITEIHDCTEKYGVVTVLAETDRGYAKIEIRNVLHSLKLLYGSRVLIRDINDNRYEIPNLEQLDKRSRQMIELYL